MAKFSRELALDLKVLIFLSRLFLKDRNDFSVWWRAAFLGSTFLGSAFASGVVMARELDERYCTFGW